LPKKVADYEKSGRAKAAVTCGFAFGKERKMKINNSVFCIVPFKYEELKVLIIKKVLNAPASLHFLKKLIQ